MSDWADVSIKYRPSLKLGDKLAKGLYKQIELINRMKYTKKSLKLFVIPTEYLMSNKLWPFYIEIYYIRGSKLLGHTVLPIKANDIGAVCPRRLCLFI